MADQYQAGFVRDSATGALTVIGPSSGDVSSGRLLTSASKVDANFTSVAAFADVTGLTAITFTAPASGAVLVRAVCTGFNDTATNAVVMKVVDNAGPTDVCQSQSHVSTAASQQAALVTERRVTGLTPGAAKSYKLQAGRALSAAGTATLIGSTAQPIIVTVFAA